MAKSTASGSGVGTSLPSGVVMPFAGEVIPVGWLLCDGSQVSRSGFRDLFNAIGTAWGEGDGSSTFHVPDMRGTFLRGQDDGAGRDPDSGTRTAINTGGNTADAVGSYQDAEVGQHSHSIRGEFNNQCCGSSIAMFTYPNGNPRWNNTELSGGAETRPKNVNVKYIIKV